MIQFKLVDKDIVDPLASGVFLNFAKRPICEFNCHSLKQPWWIKRIRAMDITTVLQNSIQGIPVLPSKSEKTRKLECIRHFTTRSTTLCSIFMIFRCWLSQLVFNRILRIGSFFCIYEESKYKNRALIAFIAYVQCVKQTRKGVPSQRHIITIGEGDCGF